MKFDSPLASLKAGRAALLAAALLAMGIGLLLFAASPAGVDAQSNLPGPPTGLTLSGGNHQIGTSWTAPSNDGGSALTGYTVQYCLTSTGCQNASDWTDGSGTGTDTSVRLELLVNGEEYAVRVRALNANGHSDWVQGTATTRALSGCLNADLYCGHLTVADGGGSLIGYSGDAGFGGLLPDSFLYDGAEYVITQIGQFTDDDSSKSFMLTVYQPANLGDLALAVAGKYYDIDSHKAETEGARFYSDAPDLADGSTYTVRVGPKGVTFLEDSLTIDVYDNTPAGATVEDPLVTAYDIRGGSRRYTLSGTDAGLFGIDRYHGRLSLAANNTLDRNSYSFDVVATDSADNTNTDSIGITVNVLECDAIWCATLTAEQDVNTYGYQRNPAFGTS